MFKYVHNRKGLTLIEMLVVLVIVMFVLAVTLSFTQLGVTTFVSGDQQFDIQSHTRIASHYITRNVRFATELTLVDVSEASGSRDADYHYIYVDNGTLYHYDGNTQIFSFDGYIIEDNSILSGVGSRNLGIKIVSQYPGQPTYEMDNEVGIVNFTLSSNTNTIAVSGVSSPLNMGLKAIKFSSDSTFLPGGGGPSAPVITLIGAPVIAIEQNDSFTDPGATAQDSVDGNITGSIVVSGDTVNPNVLGSYTIRYNVTNSEGIAAAERTRTVNVVETIAEFTLTVTSSSGGSTIPSGSQTVNAGDVVSLSATADTDYQFVNWTASSGSFSTPNNASTTFTMPSQDVTVTAIFDEIEVSSGLSGLSSNRATLSPAFNNSITSYTATGSGNHQITVSGPGTITVNGTVIPSGGSTGNISIGSTVTIVVTEPGKLPKTYTIN